VRTAAALLLAAAIASGATTATWEMNGYQDFLRGRMSGLALTRDGQLILGPKLDTLFTSDQPEIWNVARGPDGSLYLATGNRGRLFKLDPSGRSTLLWTADQPEIFAIAVDSKGVVYAGTSPEGKVYRIENGKASEYFAPEARYIWALAVASNGDLFVATGDKGRIYRVMGAGKGEIYYETGQVHVTALATDSQGRLLAGTEPNGILYRITARQKAFVLYDASLPEIRAIVPAPDGTIYVAALGGGVARQASAASSAATSLTSSTALPTVSTTITVTDQQAGGLIAPPRPSTAPIAAANSPAVTSFSSPGSSYGDDRSALYKIHPDNTVETLWTSKEENIYDLALDRGAILFLTDAQGRIYRLDSDRTAVLVAQVGEGDATRLLAEPGGTLAATGNLAKIVRLGNDPGATGWFESPVHDAGTVARWGRIAWTNGGKTGGLAFRTRTGNTARPDGTWSEWSDPVNHADRAAITSPNARYIQWRAEFTGGSNASPGLDHVSVAYLPQNTPPVVRSIHISSQAPVGALKTGTSSPGTPASTAAFSITVTDTGDVSTPTGTPSQMLSRSAGSQMQIAWQADDPDGDRLLYNLYFRGEEESQWKLLRGDMTENTYTLEGDVLADGRYFFRVTASDRLSNPLELARDAAMVSSPVLIDNTPPVVTASAPRRRGTVLEADVDAEDRGSVLRRCEYSVDAGPWTPVEAADGVTDSARERFQLRLENFPAGEHLIVIRVYDAAGNAGLAKIVVR